MKDELKEMLDVIRKLVEQSPNRGSYGITHKKWKQLLDYITNLQEENKKYEEFVNELRKIVNGELVPRYNTNSERAKFHFNEGWSLFKSFVEDRMAKFIGEDKDVNTTN